ncbi:hypothetical protein ACER0C_017411 [Sarotherodon galilaeus]
MIRNSNETTAIVHVDFSEAWKCKFISEVQSCHYGQNLPQITSHRVLHKLQEEAVIWTYMDQVLKDIHARFPYINIVHFWSDCPSKQYKITRTFSSFLPSLPNSDSSIQHGIFLYIPRVPQMALGQQWRDVQSAFRLSGVKLHCVITDDIQSYAAILIQPLKSITGTRKIHQVLAQENGSLQKHETCLVMFTPKMLKTSNKAIFSSKHPPPSCTTSM